MLSKITLQKPRILVADDEEFNRLLLSRILHQDYEVDFAKNGEDVLNQLNSRDYDALLLDVMMPIMDGITCLKIIREIVDFATLPVIMVSALSDKDSIVRGIQLGANDYITKPLDAEIIRARLDTQVSLKKLMDERNQAISTLQEANQLKARMMQIASHDLKNPLNNLGMVTSILTEMLAEDKKASHVLSMADKSIMTMLGIINEFLTGQDLTEGIVADIEQISALDVVSQVLEQNEVAANHKNIEVITDYQGNASIFADEKRLNQVMNNLISNAIKYSPKDSRVIVRTMQNQDIWRLEIQDSGAGIPEEERQFLFQAFSKHHISTQPTAGESSTGLGLWIAAEMMRVQNGAIGMDSPQEGGCCFWIELPLADEALLIGA